MRTDMRFAAWSRGAKIRTPDFTWTDLRPGLLENRPPKKLDLRLKGPMA